MRVIEHAALPINWRLARVEIFRLILVAERASSERDNLSRFAVDRKDQAIAEVVEPSGAVFAASHSVGLRFFPPRFAPSGSGVFDYTLKPSTDTLFSVQTVPPTQGAARAAALRQAARLGSLAFQEPSTAAEFASEEILSPTGDLREAAATLFAKMRRLDEAGLDMIIAEQVPERGLGIAIMDRLRKAAAQHV